VNRLGTNGAVHEAGKATRASGRGGSSTSISLRLSEEGPEAAEDAGAWAERHDGSLYSSGLSGDFGERGRWTARCGRVQERKRNHSSRYRMPKLSVGDYTHQFLRCSVLSWIPYSAPRELDATLDIESGCARNGTSNCHPPHHSWTNSLWRRNMPSVKASRSCGFFSARPASTAPRHGNAQFTHQPSRACNAPLRQRDWTSSICRICLANETNTAPSSRAHTPP
jgi:hypothetical protein